MAETYHDELDLVAQIVAFKHAGLSIREIARRMDVDRRRVARLLAKYADSLPDEQREMTAEEIAEFIRELEQSESPSGESDGADDSEAEGDARSGDAGKGESEIEPGGDDAGDADGEPERFTDGDADGDGEGDTPDADGETETDADAGDADTDGETETDADAGDADTDEQSEGEDEQDVEDAGDYPEPDYPEPMRDVFDSDDEHQAALREWQLAYTRKLQAASMTVQQIAFVLGVSTEYVEHLIAEADKADAEAKAQAEAEAQERAKQQEQEQGEVEHPERADGESYRDFALRRQEAYIAQVRERESMTLKELAKALGVTVNYAWSLRAIDAGTAKRLDIPAQLVEPDSPEPTDRKALKSWQRTYARKLKDAGLPRKQIAVVLAIGYDTAGAMLKG